MNTSAVPTALRRQAERFGCEPCKRMAGFPLFFLCRVVENRSGFGGQIGRLFFGLVWEMSS